MPRAAASITELYIQYGGLMTTTTALIEEVEYLLGDKTFIPLVELIDLGLFGSHSAALAAVKNGKLPIVKVSKHRFVVPRSAVIRFICENFRESEHV